MSLDVYLYGPAETVSCECAECGHTYSRETQECLFSANVTHNLNKMAGEAGIYQALWRPEEIGATRAKDIIEIVSQGLAKLKADPNRFTPFNPANGWGSYEQFVPWVEEYLAALKENPEAEIQVSR